eukprot:3706380-Amphidinium_carterae.1
MESFESIGTYESDVHTLPGSLENSSGLSVVTYMEQKTLPVQWRRRSSPLKDYQFGKSIQPTYNQR